MQGSDSCRPGISAFAKFRTEKCYHVWDEATLIHYEAYFKNFVDKAWAYRSIEAHIDRVVKDLNFLWSLFRIKCFESDGMQLHGLLEFEVDQELLVAVARQEDSIVITGALKTHQLVMG